MPIEPIQIFSRDAADMASYAGTSPVELFNRGIVPLINALDPPKRFGYDDLTEDFDEEFEDATERRQQRADYDLAQAFAREAADDAFLAQQREQRQQAQEQGPTFVDSPELGDLPNDLTSFVKNFEGYSATAFDDYKQRSIGYGTRARDGETTISKREAEERLAAELGAHRRRVLDHAAKFGYQFSESQITALTSFDYNTGALEKLTAKGTRSPAQIAKMIPAYNKAGGKVLRGLARRRAAEQKLFLR